MSVKRFAPCAKCHSVPGARGQPAPTITLSLTRSCTALTLAFSSCFSPVQISDSNSNICRNSYNYNQNQYDFSEYITPVYK